MGKKNFFIKIDEAVEGLFEELSDFVSGDVFDMKEKEVNNDGNGSDGIGTDDIEQPKQRKPANTFVPAQKGKKVVRAESGGSGNATKRVAGNAEPATPAAEEPDSSEPDDTK